MGDKKDNEIFECVICHEDFEEKEKYLEHNWSFGHHIKLEHKKKITDHTCGLCKTSHKSLVEYGDHLNGPDHSRAMRRRQTIQESERKPNEARSRTLQTWENTRSFSRRSAESDCRRTSYSSYDGNSFRGSNTQKEYSNSASRSPFPTPRTWHNNNTNRPTSRFSRPQNKGRSRQHGDTYVYKQPYPNQAPGFFNAPRFQSERMTNPNFSGTSFCRFFPPQWSCSVLPFHPNWMQNDDFHGVPAYRDFSRSWEQWNPLLPCTEAQAEVYNEAEDRANVSPDSTSAIEFHENEKRDPSQEHNKNLDTDLDKLRIDKMFFIDKKGERDNHSEATDITSGSRNFGEQSESKNVNEFVGTKNESNHRDRKNNNSMGKRSSCKLRIGNGTKCITTKNLIHNKKVHSSDVKKPVNSKYLDNKKLVSDVSGKNKETVVATVLEKNCQSKQVNDVPAKESNEDNEVKMGCGNRTTQPEFQVAAKQTKVKTKDKLTTDNVDRTTKETIMTKEDLIKLVTQPRSRHQHLQLTALLRAYSRSTKKLTLPRFNISMTPAGTECTETAKLGNREEIDFVSELDALGIVESLIDEIPSTMWTEIQNLLAPNPNAYNQELAVACQEDSRECTKAVTELVAEGKLSKGETSSEEPTEKGFPTPKIITRTANQENHVENLLPKSPLAIDRHLSKSQDKLHMRNRLLQQEYQAIAVGENAASAVDNEVLQQSKAILRNDTSKSKIDTLADRETFRSKVVLENHLFQSNTKSLPSSQLKESLSEILLSESPANSTSEQSEKPQESDQVLLKLKAEPVTPEKSEPELNPSNLPPRDDNTILESQKEFDYSLVDVKQEIMTECDENEFGRESDSDAEMSLTPVSPGNASTCKINLVTSSSGASTVAHSLNSATTSHKQTEQGTVSISVCETSDAHIEQPDSGSKAKSEQIDGCQNKATELPITTVASDIGWQHVEGHDFVQTTIEPMPQSTHVDTSLEKIDSPVEMSNNSKLRESEVKDRLLEISMAEIDVTDERKAMEDKLSRLKKTLEETQLQITQAESYLQQLVTREQELISERRELLKDMRGDLLQKNIAQNTPSSHQPNTDSRIVDMTSRSIISPVDAKGPPISTSVASSVQSVADSLPFTEHISDISSGDLTYLGTLSEELLLKLHEEFLQKCSGVAQVTSNQEKAVQIVSLPQTTPEADSSVLDRMSVLSSSQTSSLEHLPVVKLKRLASESQSAIKKRKITAPKSKKTDAKTRKRTKLLENSVKKDVQEFKPRENKDGMNTVCYQGHTAAVVDMTVYEEAGKDYLFTCSGDKTALRFDLKTGQCLNVYSDHEEVVTGLCIVSEAGTKKYHKRLLTGCLDGNLRSFSVQSGKLNKKTYLEGRIHSLCASTVLGRVYAGLSDGNIVCMKTKVYNVIANWSCTTGVIKALTMAREGVRHLLLVLSTEKSVMVRDAETGLFLRVLTGHEVAPSSVQISGALAYSTSIDATGEDNVLLVHEICTGKLVSTIKDRIGLSSKLFVEDNMIWSCGIQGCTDAEERSQGYICCHNINTGKLLNVYYGASYDIVMSVYVHGNKLISGNRTGKVESIPISNSTSFTCKKDGCKLPFAYKSHLMHHMLRCHRRS